LAASRLRFVGIRPARSHLKFVQRPLKNQFFLLGLFYYHRAMPAAADSSLVLSFEDARRTVEEHAAHVQPIGTETVDLLNGLGRVLAEPLLADRDLPPFPRSARDGYAVRTSDLEQLPTLLVVSGEIKAGAKPSDIPAAVDPGQAVSIMTGAPVPSGADAVVMVEHTSRRNEFVEISRGLAQGENVVPRGAEAPQGSRLLEPGCRLNDAAIALAASVGKLQLVVYKRPRVALLTTGDEVVKVDSVPGPTQIRNSNSYSLAAQTLAAGGQPVLLPIAPDESQRLQWLVERGLQSDLLLLTGGVSMGRYDVVEQALAEMGGEFFFTGAQIQPGRPVVFGRLPVEGYAGAAAHKYFFGLPGNPVSTMVTFELFVRPLLEALAGLAPRQLRFLHARLKSEVRVKTGLKRFLPAILSGEFESAEVERVPWQGSGDVAATARANCYIVVPPDREFIAAGEWVAVLPR
jgi:molybdopterin molybdotransferase